MATAKRTKIANRTTARAARPATGSKAAKRAVATTPARSTTTTGMAPRADFGKPIDSFFDTQPAALRDVLVELRRLVEAAAPEATSSIKWGMPFFQINGKMFAALGAHKAHVNLILSGPPGAFKDPSGRLTGEGKTGRHLKLTNISELRRNEVRGWLATAAHLARTR